METFDDEHVEHAAEEASVSTNGSQQPLSESVIELTVAKAPPSSRCEDDGLASEQAQTAPENESLVVGLQDAPRDHEGAASIRANFILMSLLVSTLPASSLACLALATEQLGSIGAWQSGTLYFTYTLSAITGATYVVKSYGSRNALIIGMALFCLYVTCFFLATFGAWERPLALTGAAIGGIGAGIFWTSVGAYLSRAAEEYSLASGMNWDESTGYLAAIFAFIFLAEETTLDVLSTVLTEAGLPWILVFALYAALAILATSFMKAVKTYPVEEDTASSVTPFRDSVYKATSALYLLVKDPKMKYMLGLNCAFGLAGAFLNSFVNGEVVPVVMSEDYVGLLVAIHGGTAAIFSLIFGYLAQYTGKTPILIMGSICLGSVAYPFLWQPDLTQWTWISVGSIYVLAGIGRATFEGTLKAVFADYFVYEKEGAYANIILQNGLATSIGWVMSIRLTCSTEGTYCIRYRDNSLHQVFTFGVVVVVMSILGVLGCWRAAVLHQAGGRQVEAYRHRTVSSYRANQVDRRSYNSVRT